MDWHKAALLAAILLPCGAGAQEKASTAELAKRLLPRALAARVTSHVEPVPYIYAMYQQPRIIFFTQAKPYRRGLCRRQSFQVLLASPTNEGPTAAGVVRGDDLAVSNQCAGLPHSAFAMVNGTLGEAAEALLFARQVRDAARKGEPLPVEAVCPRSPSLNCASQLAAMQLENAVEVYGGGDRWTVSYTGRPKAREETLVGLGQWHMTVDRTAKGRPVVELIRRDIGPF